MPFERYKLKSNPFLQESADFELIDRAEVMDEAKMKLDGMIAARTPTISAVLGTYGIGKTFTLHNLVQRLEKGEYLAVESTPLLWVYIKVIPARPPTKYQHYLYTEIVREIGQETFTALLQLAKERAGDDLSVHELLDGLDTDFRNAFIRLDSSTSDEAWAFLKGEKLTVSRQRGIDVSTSITGDRTALKMTLELLKLLSILGYKGLLLLIDEFEYIFTAASATKGAQIITSYKELYDRVNELIWKDVALAPPLFLFACTPGEWDEKIPSLMDRVGRGGIFPFWDRVQWRYEIPAFREEDTLRLIKSRLLARRSSSVPNELYPFTEDAIRAIHEEGEGIPRRILRRAGHVLDRGHLDGKGMIEEGYVRDVLKDYALQ